MEPLTEIQVHTQNGAFDDLEAVEVQCCMTRRSWSIDIGSGCATEATAVVPLPKFFTPHPLG